MSAQERFNIMTRNHCSYSALDYAEQTMRVYRKAVLTSRKRGFDKPHHASLPEYRPLFIKDYLEFKWIVTSARRCGSPPRNATRDSIVPAPVDLATRNTGSPAAVIPGRDSQPAAVNRGDGQAFVTR